MNLIDKYLVCFDAGTTSCRTLIVNHNQEIVSISQLEFKQYFPHSGWVEHDAIEILNTQKTTFIQAKNKAQIKSASFAGCGITNQRETIVVWDKDNGQPVYNAIVWQDNRTGEYCNYLAKDPKINKMFHEKTGLEINPYFSGTKLRWILKNIPRCAYLLKNNRLLAGTIDSWLIWNFTGRQHHVTDVSNASRTLLFNINTLEWDNEILKLFGIPKEILPKVLSSGDNFGEIVPEMISGPGSTPIPIKGVLGDQQSALFGHLSVNPGDVKNTYGTGCFTLMNIGTKPILSKNKLLTTIAWKIKNEPPIYALEGSVFIGGAAIQWLRDGIKIIYTSGEVDFLINEIKTEQNIYFVPAFTGLGAPWWDPYAKGAIFGLDRSTKREDIVKATIDAIAYQTNDLLECMQKDYGKKILSLKVDGGVTNSKYLLQFQSDISDVTIEAPANLEITAMGVIYMTGLILGYWNSIDDLKHYNSKKTDYKPHRSQKWREQKISTWTKAVQRTLNWIEN